MTVPVTSIAYAVIIVKVWDVVGDHPARIVDVDLLPAMGGNSMMWHPGFEYEIVQEHLESRRREAAYERLIHRAQQAHPGRLQQTLGGMLTQSGRLLIRLGEGLVEPSGMHSTPSDVTPHR